MTKYTLTKHQLFEYGKRLFEEGLGRVLKTDFVDDDITDINRRDSAVSKAFNDLINEKSEGPPLINWYDYGNEFKE